MINFAEMKKGLIYLLGMFLFLLGSCVSDPEDNTTPPEGQVAVPVGFDWKMTRDATYTFRVSDAQPAVVRIFTASDGDMIASGTASSGDPFVTTLTLPRAQTTIFVQKISANHSVVERTITLSQAANYLFPAPTAMKPVGVVAKVARELPAFDLEVTSGSSVNLYRWESGANRAYRNVRLAGTFSGSVNFMWTTVDNSSTVYIDGNVRITSMSNQDKPGNKIIVLAGATLTIDGITEIDVEVDPGGTLRCVAAYNSRKNLLNNGTLIFDETLLVNAYSGVAGQLINNGTLQAKKAAEVTNLNSYFENNGTATFEAGYKQNVSSVGRNNGAIDVTGTFYVTNSAVFHNNGTVEANVVELSANPVLNNNCQISCEQFQSGNTGCVVNLASGGLISTDLLYTTGGLTLNMARGSMFLASDVNVYQLQLTASGAGSAIALFRFDHAISVHTSAFSGPVEVVCEAYQSEASAYYNTTFANGASQKTAQSVSVAETECNGGAGLIGGEVEDPENGDTPNSFLPSQNGFNTLVFEDMWPKEGDYDMNDVVVAFRIGFFEQDNKVSRMIFTGKVLAIGAGSPNHALGLQLDEVLPAGITSVTRSIALGTGVFSVAASGAESGTTAAVIPLFSKAKDMVTVTAQGNSFINTDPQGGTTATPREWTVDVRFATPVDKNKLTLNAGLNFFLIVQGAREKEIHLYGFDPSSKAGQGYFGTQDDNSATGPYYSTRFGYPWGLVIPGIFRYPVEKTALNAAYLKYDAWITSNKASYPDWYLLSPGYVDANKLYPELP